MKQNRKTPSITKRLIKILSRVKKMHYNDLISNLRTLKIEILQKEHLLERINSYENLQRIKQEGKRQIFIINIQLKNEQKKPSGERRNVYVNTLELELEQETARNVKTQALLMDLHPWVYPTVVPSTCTFSTHLDY